VFTTVGAWSGRLDEVRRNSNLGPLGLTGLALGMSVVVWLFLFLGLVRVYAWYADERTGFLVWMFAWFLGGAIYIALQLLVLDIFLPGIHTQDAYTWTARGIGAWFFFGMFGLIFVQERK
jgi:hypothetical protein